MWDLTVSVPDHCLSFYFVGLAKSTFLCFITVIDFILMHTVS